MATKKRKRKRRTATGHAPLVIGSLGLGAVEIVARAVRNESAGQTREEAWRNATADVLEKAARDDGEAADALTEAAQVIRVGDRDEG